MEKRNPSHMASDARIIRGRTISAPAPYEGVGNALRAAFDSGSYRMPEELAALLRRLD